MVEWGAFIAVLVGASGVIGFILRLLYTSLTKSIEQNRQDRLHAISELWARVDKLRDELPKEYVRMEYLREVEQRMITRMDEISAAIRDLRSDLRRNPSLRERAEDRDDGK